ncbi:MAG: Hemagglutinin precursor [Bacteroidota bacterium]
MKFLHLLQTALFLGISSLAIAQAPTNDDCAGAIAVTIAADAASCTPTTVSTVGATQSAEANSCSVTWFDDDVWYSFTTGATLPDSIVVQGATGTITNFGMAVYDGCGGTALGCFSGARRSLGMARAALLPNTTYLVRVWGAGVGAATQGDMTICIYAAMLPTIPVPLLSTMSAHVFGAVGAAATPIDVILSNGGGVALNVTSVTSSSPQFAVSLASGTMVAAGGSSPFTVTYTANDLVDDLTTITVNTDGGPVTLTVSGYAYDASMVYETFDAGLPSSFTQNDVDGDGNGYFGFGVINSPFTGDSCLASASWLNNVALTPDNYLVLPQMTPRTGNSTFSYFVTAQDPAFPAEHYEIRVSTTDNQPASFTTSLFNETLPDNIWNEHRIDLSAYNNQPIYVAIRHFNVTDMFFIKFDDFRFPNLITATDNSVSKATAIKVTPNPSNGNFNLSWDATQTDVAIRITDVQGKEVLAVRPVSSATSADLNLTNIGSGVYTVRLSGSQGVQTTKLTILK